MAVEQACSAAQKVRADEGRGRVRGVDLPFMRLESAGLRRLAWLGAARGPRWWLRFSPPPIGLIAAAVSPQQRSHVRFGLRCLHGRRCAIAEHYDVARTFVQFAQSLAETLGMRGTTDRQPAIHVTGTHHLQRAIRGGRGVIVGTAHTAGWELALWVLGKDHAGPVIVAMQAEPDPTARAYHIVENGSADRSVALVGDDPLASIPLLQALRGGGLVAMQLDRCPTGMKTVEIVAGRKVWTLPAGPFVLAAAAGAPIVMALAKRTGFLTYELRISAPIFVERRTIIERSRAAENVARELARHVYAAPTQWFDFGPR